MSNFQWEKIIKDSDLPFLDKALQLFQWQCDYNRTYKNFLLQLGIYPANVTQLTQIPFLPIQFFKTKKIATTSFTPQQIFTSSGTTSTTTSLHFVKEVSIYETAFMQGFQQFYGNISEYCIIGLLPSYMERQGSSLVYMVDYLVKKSNHSSSGFYLDEYEQLYTLLQQLEAKGQKTILIGVTFALLDFAAQYPMELQHTIVMETGGMKGRGIEPTRMEVQTLLRQQLGVFKVHSEYGMTELLSQAYSNGDGLFTPATTMQVLVRSEDDPLQVNTTGNGLLNIIDLANVYSCAFIATDDIGTVYHDGTFTVLGRADNSDTRGCSLLTVH